MSGRPRLVHEGEHIYGPNTSSNPHNGRRKRNDHDRYCSRLHVGNQEFQANSGPFNSSVSLKATETVKSSSLSKATKSVSSLSSKYRKKKLVTHFEIGSERDNGNDVTIGKDKTDNIFSSYAQGILESDDMVEDGSMAKPEDNSLDNDRCHDYNRNFEFDTNFSIPTVATDNAIAMEVSSIHQEGSIQSHFVIEGNETDQKIDTHFSQEPHHDQEQQFLERMEVEDILPKPPLIVMDGANIAYAYADTSRVETSLSCSASKSKSKEPDAEGIRIAVDYFVKAGCRVQVVVPVYWLRSKPRPGDYNGKYIRFCLGIS